MAEIKLTPQQEKAVYDRGGELLVSAAAGSGKTKVLVERLFSYLREGANVDDFLIITYTKAAAAELRSKIAAELSRQLAARPEDGHLRRQLFRVYQADIKTVDAFCVGVLRQNTHLLEPVNGKTLTPDFRVLDEKESLLLRQRVLERTLDDFYEHLDKGGEFLAETLGAGRDDRALFAIVLELHQKLQSHPYPLQWLGEVEAGWQNIPQDLSETPYGQLIIEDTLRRTEFWAGQLERAAALCEGDEKLKKGYQDRLMEAAAALRLFPAAAARGWDAVAALQPTVGPMGRAPDSPEKLQIQTVIGHCRKILKEMNAFFSVPQSRHREDLMAMAPAMLALLRLTARFTQNYQQEKARRNVMDFSDQEHYAIDLLRQGDAPTDLARTLSERYREVMVDEYQDSNAVQDCIYRSVSREGEKLFCVGDVKQSIYRFRLADPTIFLKKYLAYPDAAGPGQEGPRRVLLARNFRSRQEVLDITNFVMAAILSPEMGEMHYGETERLYPGADYYLPRSDCRPEFHLVDVTDTEDERFDRQEVEARFVADRVRRLLDEGFPVQEGGHLRPCTAEDIVILMRSPRSRMKVLTDALERRGIPCTSGERSDFFDTVEIAVVFSLLQIVDNPRQDVPLISVLRSPLFGFTADDLARVRALQKTGDFYEALLLDESEKARAFSEELHALRRSAREQTVDRFLWQCYSRLHILSVFAAMPQGEQRRQNLLALYEYARQMTAAGVRSVFDFVTQLRRLIENKETPTVCTQAVGAGVQIMSIHKSKGLEFPIVILCDLNKRFDQRDQQPPVLVHQDLGLGTERVDPTRRIRYDTISKMALALTLNRESKSEEMRLLYVAMTRAKEKLILVDCMKRKGKHLQKLSTMASYPLEPEAAASAQALGDWLLMPLLCAPEGAALREYIGIPVEGLTAQPCGVEVRVWHNPGTAAPDRRTAPAQEHGSAGLQPEPAALDWHYGHDRACGIPTKVTATQLKGREVDREIAQGAVPAPRRLGFDKPLFMQEAVGLSAAEKGTTIHLCMQYLDFSLPATEEAVEGFVEDLRRRRLLTEPEARAVDKTLLLQFLRTPLCRRMARAEELYREYRFSLLVDAGDFYDPAAAGEQMLLQGVVDCAFVEQGKLVLVDFKTDRVTAETAPRRAESYCPQLEAYTHALERVLEKEVSEKLLYFFRCDTCLSL